MLLISWLIYFDLRYNKSKKLFARTLILQVHKLIPTKTSNCSVGWRDHNWQAGYIPDSPDNFQAIKKHFNQLVARHFSFR